MVIQLLYIENFESKANEVNKMLNSLDSITPINKVITNPPNYIFAFYDNI